MRLIDNEHDFKFLRDHFLYKPTVSEYQIASRIANTINQNTTETIDDPLIQIRLRQKSKWDDNVILHNKHEAHFASYKQDIHQLWNQTFNKTLIQKQTQYIKNINTSTASI